jgi:hypothetical protein
MTGSTNGGELHAQLTAASAGRDAEALAGVVFEPQATVVEAKADARLSECRVLCDPSGSARWGARGTRSGMGPGFSAEQALIRHLDEPGARPSRRPVPRRTEERQPPAVRPPSSDDQHNQHKSSGSH